MLKILFSRVGLILTAAAGATGYTVTKTAFKIQEKIKNKNHQNINYLSNKKFDSEEVKLKDNKYSLKLLTKYNKHISKKDIINIFENSEYDVFIDKDENKYWENIGNPGKYNFKIKLSKKSKYVPNKIIDSKFINFELQIIDSSVIQKYIDVVKDFDKKSTYELIPASDVARETSMVKDMSQQEKTFTNFGIKGLDAKLPKLLDFKVDHNLKANNMEGKITLNSEIYVPGMNKKIKFQNELRGYMQPYTIYFDNNKNHLMKYMANAKYYKSYTWHQYHIKMTFKVGNKEVEYTLHDRGMQLYKKPYSIKFYIDQLPANQDINFHWSGQAKGLNGKESGLITTMHYFDGVKVFNYDAYHKKGDYNVGLSGIIKR